MSIGRIIYKAIGIMPKKEILRCSEDIGRRVNSVIGKNGNITPEAIQEIFSEVIGKGARKIDLITTEEECIKAIQQNLQISENVAQQMSKTCLSAVIPRGATKNNTLLNLRIGNLSKEVLANTTAHETEHALYDAFGIETFLSNIRLFKKNSNKSIAKINETLNKYFHSLEPALFHNIGNFGINACYGWTKYKGTLDGLLKQTGCKTKGELQTKILKLLYENKFLAVSNNAKNNFTLLYILDVVKSLLKDEARAYKVGGAIQKEAYNAMHVAIGKHATKSTMNSMLYEEACDVLGKEYKHILGDMIKNLFGIKTSEKSVNRLAEKGVKAYRLKK